MLGMKMDQSLAFGSTTCGVSDQLKCKGEGRGVGREDISLKFNGLLKIL